MISSVIDVAIGTEFSVVATAELTFSAEVTTSVEMAFVELSDSDSQPATTSITAPKLAAAQTNCLRCIISTLRCPFWFSCPSITLTVDRSPSRFIVASTHVRDR